MFNYKIISNYRDNDKVCEKLNNKNTLIDL